MAALCCAKMLCSTSALGSFVLPPSGIPDVYMVGQMSSPTLLSVTEPLQTIHLHPETSKQRMESKRSVVSGEAFLQLCRTGCYSACNAVTNLTSLQTLLELAGIDFRRPVCRK